jgi:hypothetical protein
MLAGHGPNVGHGFTKYVVIDEHGVELPPVVFPSLVARAGRTVAGALNQTPTVQVAAGRWWTGEDALLAPAPISLLSQDRLADPNFIPALVAGALARFPALNGAAPAFCVSGLPATWARDADKARMLGERLRAGTPLYARIRVIPEPLGLLYSVLLDNHGQLVGDPALQSGRVGAIELGHHTDDVAILDRLRPLDSSLATLPLGTARPLQQIRATLTARFERDFTLFEVDTAIRAGYVTIAGQRRPLPRSWDRPLLDNGAAVAARLVEALGTGGDLDTILIGGGGGELEQKVAPILRRFPHAQLVDRPQLAVAIGYARLARRLALEAR